MRCAFTLTCLFVCVLCLASALSAAAPKSSYQAWKNGPPTDPSFFPLAVWCQDPKNAEAFKAIGINTYVALWDGPTEEQLAKLKAVGMKVVCDQNAVGLKHLNDPTIIGWMHGDEPDNAQRLHGSKGYGPPILPSTVVQDYQRLRAADPSRPVMLNLGQGVAWDGWHGRGARSNHPEDYLEYVRGCDIVSFDIYPVAHSAPQVSGDLWYVARGVDRLVKWSAGQKVVWNCIECTHIQSTNKATPSQVRSEVWMSLIHGSKGLIYFVHEWKPKFDEAALLHDPEMLRAVTALNRQIAELAPVLNSPSVIHGMETSSSSLRAPAAPKVTRHDGTSYPFPQAPLAVMMKRHEGATYVFAVEMRSEEHSATFTVYGLSGDKTVDVLGEDRTLTAHNGIFSDTFGPWAAHCYHIK